jgi:hypothetical protein
MLHTLRFSLQNAIYFIMLSFLVPVLFTFYIQGVLKFKRNDGRSRCERATWRCTSTPAPAVTVSSLWCDDQIPTAHRTSPYRYRVTNFWYVMRSRVPSTLSRYGVKIRGNVTSVYPPLEFFLSTNHFSMVKITWLFDFTEPPGLSPCTEQSITGFSPHWAKIKSLLYTVYLKLYYNLISPHFLKLFSTTSCVSPYILKL